jgi:hypothetical protein
MEPASSKSEDWSNEGENLTKVLMWQMVKEWVKDVARNQSLAMALSWRHWNITKDHIYMRAKDGWNSAGSFPGTYLQVVPVLPYWAYVMSLGMQEFARYCPQWQLQFQQGQFLWKRK